MADVLLNFRTGFIDPQNIEVMCWKQVAGHYMRGWFLLDLVSSVPFGRFTSFNANMLKLGKIGKVARVFKIFKTGETTQQVSEFIDDTFSSFVQRCRRRSGVLVITFILCHWLACGLKLFDAEMLRNYQDVMGSIDREYGAA